MNNLKLNQPVKTGQRFFYGYILVAAALIIIILFYGARFSYGVFFKPMLTEFGWTRALTSGAFTFSMLLQGVGSILMGRLNDKLGPRFVMTICSVIFGLGYLLMSQVNGTWQLFLIYGVIVGIGMGGPFVALLSTIARWFVKRRGIMTGIVIAGTGVGTFIVPPISNWLISVYDWRMSYLIVGIVVLVVGVLVAQFLRRDPAKMGLAPYGESKGEKQKLASGDQGFSLKEAMVTRQFWMVMFIFFCLGYCVFTMNVHLVPNITDLGISATTATNVLAAMGVFTAIGCIVLGSATDKIGSKLTCIITFILLAAGLFWLAFIKEVWMLYLYAIVYGLGAGGGAPLESIIAAEQFGMKSHGVIFGVISFSFTIGGALGPFLTGYLFDIAGNYQVAFLICAAFGVVGVLLATMLRSVKKQEIKI